MKPCPVKLIFDLFVHLPQRRKILLGPHPAPQSHHDAAVAKLRDKHLRLLFPDHVFAVFNNLQKHLLRFADIVLVGDSYRDVQFSAICAGRIDDHIVCKVSVWNDDLAVVDRVQRGVEDLDLLHCALFSLREDVIADLKWLEQKDQKSARQI